MNIKDEDFSPCPNKTSWEDGMMVATFAIGKDSTFSITCHKDDIESLRQQQAEHSIQDKRDAERYRWLRDKHNANNQEWFVYAASTLNLDSDIEAAIKIEEEEKSEESRNNGQFGVGA